MNIIYIGDIFGRPGRRAVREILPELKKQYQPALVLANGENMASGGGFTVETYREVLESGVDFLTSGDHTWDRPEIYPILKTQNEKLLRPANYPDRDPGRGWTDILVGKTRVRLINLLGNVFIRHHLPSPFYTLDRILDDAHRPAITIVDFHAEATSEKIAFSWYADGRVSAVVGTHTHVQTNDARLLPGGTAALTDLGMTGPRDGVIGMDKNLIVESYLTQMPWERAVQTGPVILSGAFIEVDETSGQATQIEIIKRELD